jgi:hypothetical protein
MCWSVWLASGGPLRIVPWDSNAPSFSVTPPEARDEVVRGQFRHAHMMVLGSQTQCGCGFFDEDEGPDDPRREVVRRLVNYLEEVLRDSPEIELFACWEGGERDPPAQKLDLHPSDFGASRFPVGDDIHGSSGYARIAL